MAILAIMAAEPGLGLGLGGLGLGLIATGARTYGAT